MTLIAIISVGVFLLACESLYYWRGKLIGSHRALARSIIIGDTSLTFWEDVARMNSYGDWDSMFWDFKRWRFSAMYPSVLQDEHSHFLGV